MAYPKLSCHLLLLLLYEHKKGRIGQRKLDCWEIGRVVVFVVYLSFLLVVVVVFDLGRRLFLLSLIRLCARSPFELRRSFSRVRERESF